MGRKQTTAHDPRGMNEQHTRPGIVTCRLCERDVERDDMAVMAYAAIACPPCCQRCWDRHVAEARRKGA